MKPSFELNATVRVETILWDGKEFEMKKGEYQIPQIIHHEGEKYRLERHLKRLDRVDYRKIKTEGHDHGRAAANDK